MDTHTHTHTHIYTHTDFIESIQKITKTNNKHWSGRGDIIIKVATLLTTWFSTKNYKTLKKHT
jgi:hypothetical protein